MATSPLRLMVYDRTCRSRGVGLSTAWSTGSLLYRGLGRLDAAQGVSSWDEALSWLATVEPTRPIAEIQYWGHGKWGRVYVADDVLDRGALGSAHHLHAPLLAVKERLTPGALVWLRTCETFGARVGLDFAQALAEVLGARVAGHTHVIHALQSGLHGLNPGHAPDWSPADGLAEGTPDAPVRALGSAPHYPRTVSCLAGEVPAAWFA